MSDQPLHVFRKRNKTGVEIKRKKRVYDIKYPYQIWEKLPKSLHRLFADSLAYISTWHLPLVNKTFLNYHFSHPPIEPVFFKILLYSIPMNIFEERNLKTSELVRQFYNANFKTQFKALDSSYSGKKVKKRLKNKAIILFSFGKDSLLTYGILSELGINSALIFMKEPQCFIENKHKKRLADKFYQKIGVEVKFFSLSIGKLRQDKDMWWGWDIILSQYAFILIPYYFYHQARYLFFGNEQSCNFYLRDKEGYLVNPVYEQSVSAMQLMQDIPKLFFIKTQIGSLVEPINEIFVTFILHHRYAEIGRFQMSCFSEEEQARNKRWCGVCEKCARMYIFLRAFNISTERVGFSNSDMLSNKKEKYYVLFNGESDISAYGGSGLGRDEQLLAFYLSYKNGAKGELIDRFRRLHLNEAEQKQEKLVEEYFGIHSSYSLPSTLRKKVLRIFDKEKKAALKY